MLEFLCKSAPAHIQFAMLTRRNAQGAVCLVQAAKLNAFTIDLKVITSKQRNGGGRDERSGNGHGGRYTSDGQVDQGGRRGG